nr:zinc ribbon domain-containing protein [Chloroflexota bacterium]
MPYCVNCGAQIAEGVRFCSSCGNPVAQAATGSTPVPPPTAQVPPAGQTPYAPLPTSEAAAGIGQAKMLVLAAGGIYVLATVLALTLGNMLAILTALIAVGVIFGLGYMPLSKGQIQEARNGITIAAGLALAYLLINLFTGEFLAGVINSLAAVALGLARNQIK